MSKYDVKFKRLALLLLPTFLRRPLIAAVAYASVIPVQYLYVRFIRWKQDTDYRLNNNGQVCYLRAVLNDMFDPGLRRITVSDTVDNIGFITVHRRDENLEKLLPRRESGRADRQPQRIQWRVRLRLLGECAFGPLRRSRYGSDQGRRQPVQTRIKTIFNNIRIV